MFDIQQPRSPETPSSRSTEHEIQDTQPIEASEPPPIKRLDGEIKRLGDIAFAGGTFCEVWVGEWSKGSKEEGGGEEIDGEKIEKVSIGFTASTS